MLQDSSPWEARMTDDFRASAARLAGLIPASLGWTPDQFWSATPAELNAVLGAFSGIASGDHTAAPLTQMQFEQLKETLNHG